MTLEELLGSKGYTYKDLGSYTDPDGSGQAENLSGWYRQADPRMYGDDVMPENGERIDPEELAFYQSFGGDYGQLARMAGYTGSNPAAFLLGMETAQGQPVPYGEWATNSGAFAVPQGFYGPEDTTPQRQYLLDNAADIQQWAFPQVGITPQQYLAGAKQSGGGIGDLFANAVFGLGAGALGAAALGMGPLAAASGSTGQGIFGAAAPTFTGGASGAGVTGATGGGSLATGGLTAAETAALSGGAGGFVGGASGGGLSGVGGAVGDAGFMGGATGGEIAGGATGGALSGAGGATQGATTALGRILSGKATNDDWAQVLGAGGSSLLGVLGSNAQADAYGDVAQQYLGLGAPFREKLLQSYQPGFSMADQPDFQNALDVGAQAAARATSARVGNPVDNPGAYAEMQKYITGSLALPQLNTYRSQLGSFGQLGTNVAGTASMGEAGQAGGAYDAIGAGLASLTRPKSPYEDLLKGILGNQGQFKLNTGFSF